MTTETPEKRGMGMTEATGEGTRSHRARSLFLSFPRNKTDSHTMWAVLEVLFLFPRNALGKSPLSPLCLRTEELSSLPRGELHKYCTAWDEADVRFSSQSSKAGSVAPHQLPDNETDCGWAPFGKFIVRPSRSGRPSKTWKIRLAGHRFVGGKERETPGPGVGAGLGRRAAEEPVDTETKGISQMSSHRAQRDKNNYQQLLGALDYSFLCAYAVGMYLSGIIGERLPIRYYLTFGMLASGAFTALFGLGYFYNIHSFGFYVVTQVINGLVQTTGWPSVVTCLGNWFGKGRRGLIMGVWNSHTSVGNILGSLIAGYWVSTCWGLSFVVPGAIVAAMGIVCFLFLIEPPWTALAGTWPDGQGSSSLTSRPTGGFQLWLVWHCSSGKGRSYHLISSTLVPRTWSSVPGFPVYFVKLFSDGSQPMDMCAQVPQELLVQTHLALQCRRGLEASRSVLSGCLLLRGVTLGRAGMDSAFHCRCSRGPALGLCSLRGIAVVVDVLSLDSFALSDPKDVRCSSTLVTEWRLPVAPGPQRHMGAGCHHLTWQLHISAGQEFCPARPSFSSVPLPSSASTGPAGRIADHEHYPSCLRPPTVNISHFPTCLRLALPGTSPLPSHGPGLGSCRHTHPQYSSWHIFIVLIAVLEESLSGSHAYSQPPRFPPPLKGASPSPGAPPGLVQEREPESSFCYHVGLLGVIHQKGVLILDDKNRETKRSLETSAFRKVGYRMVFVKLQLVLLNVLKSHFPVTSMNFSFQACRVVPYSSLELPGLPSSRLGRTLAHTFRPGTSSALYELFPPRGGQT
ncbi:hypothetical protein P7K49_032569 [Saguinus oedipus]|uniref:Solute carrier family 37 member 1 n=1 Tax=Saguinus oedipus TaxID=9490 RepID=A0ABQ9TZT0_SAGOE|nr:hypothetical protein P7K49_032569 [Saguinus oedipus]